jgi:hypothetical protein
MPKAIELRKVKRILGKYGICYITGKDRHPKFYDPETRKSYPVKSHGKKTLILQYALEDLSRNLTFQQTPSKSEKMINHSSPGQAIRRNGQGYYQTNEAIKG